MCIIGLVLWFSFSKVESDVTLSKGKLYQIFLKKEKNLFILEVKKIPMNE